jgi:hypothetical protein
MFLVVGVCVCVYERLMAEVCRSVTRPPVLLCIPLVYSVVVTRSGIFRDADRGTVFYDTACFFVLKPR